MAAASAKTPPSTANGALLETALRAVLRFDLWKWTGRRSGNQESISVLTRSAQPES
jgi:hypothetical protein